MKTLSKENGIDLFLFYSIASKKNYLKNILTYAIL